MGIPKKWMVYNEKSYLEWMISGYPYFRKPSNIILNKAICHALFQLVPGVTESMMIQRNRTPRALSSCGAWARVCLDWVTFVLGNWQTVSFRKLKVICKFRHSYFRKLETAYSETTRKGDETC